MNHKHLFVTCLLSVWSMAFVLTSCSDDEKVFTVPSGTNTEIGLDCNNNFIKLPIVADGEWTADVDCQGKADWLVLLDEKGKGNATVEAAVDFNESESDRTAVVRFTNGEQTVQYTIRQGTYDDDEQGANSADDEKYHNSGIGKVLKVKPGGGATGYQALLKKQIFNYKTMKDPSVAELPNFVTQSAPTSVDISLKDFTSLQEQEKSIRADLSVDISYGLFKLGLTGNFQMYGKDRDTLRTYAASASVPKAILEVDHTALAKYLPWSPTLTKEEKTRRLKLFSTTFVGIHDDIEETVQKLKAAENGGEGDVTQLKNELDDLLMELDAEYGPVFTTTVQKGGSVDIDFQLKNSESTDTLHIGGKLTASFSSLFSLKAEAAAEYLNASHAFTEGSTLSIEVNGGKISTMSTLIDALKSVTKANPDDTKGMLDAIITWSEGVTYENGTVISVTVAGIWELFSTRRSTNKIDAAPYVKAFFKEKYKNAEDGKCPYLFNIEALADE